MIFFRVVWNHAKMPQNTFLITPDVEKYFFMAMFLVIWKHAKMHQNTFLTTPDAKNYLFQGHVSDGLRACENPLKHGKKYLFQGHVSGGLEACANASKHVFNHSRL